MTKQYYRWWLVWTLAFAACAAAPPPSVPDDASPPWMLRRTFRGWDGKPVEMLGAPGPRAVAAFLSLAMHRSSVWRTEDLGDVPREMPDFYEFLLQRDDEPGLSDARWFVRSRDLFVPVEWEGGFYEALPQPTDLLGTYTLGELAVAINDVVWKWPRHPGSRSFMRPLRGSSAKEGEGWAELLREKIGRGKTLERAWLEVQFQQDDELYVLTLLPGEQLRVSWHPEMSPDDWPPQPTWVGKY